MNKALSITAGVGAAFWALIGIATFAASENAIQELEAIACFGIAAVCYGTLASMFK